MNAHGVPGCRGVTAVVDVHLEPQSLVVGAHRFEVGGGEDRGGALQGGHVRRRYRGRMRRLLWTLMRAALVIGLVAIVRSVLIDRAPRRALHGDEPIIGSLDTWPAVPRKPPAA